MSGQFRDLARNPVTLKARAKVNLALSVGPPDPHGTPRAGWHPICSWFHGVDLHDDVEIRSSSGSASRVHVEPAADAVAEVNVDWPMERDLAFRALQAVEQRLGAELGLEVVIRKRIPTGGGLGGGSSDAGTLLAFLWQRARHHLSEREYTLLAASIGSDVPYFLDPFCLADPNSPPRPAIVEGYGEVVTRPDARPDARLTAARITLVFPPFGCDTRAVYAQFDRRLPPGHTLRASHIRALAARPAAPSVQPAPAHEGLFNDLFPAADAVSGGRLATLKHALEAGSGATTIMSGSGSTLVVFSDAPQIPQIAAAHGARTVSTTLV